ncbi:hypothetical protein EMCRGX_G028002 [Ephydatia muelleri]
MKFLASCTSSGAGILFSQKAVFKFVSCSFRRRAELPRFSSDKAASKGIIYVHWPYCSQLCTYCNFNKYVSRDVKHDDLVSCLVQEVTTLLRMSTIDEITSVYFGGGTPSLAEPFAIEAVLARVNELVPTSPNIEVSLEVNPTSGQLHKLKHFKLAGVNRLSIGMQSLRNKDLKLFNRDHSVQDALRTLADASSLFKGRINIDMIFGRPGQSFVEWKQELSEVIQICDRHVSLYQLTVELGTPLAKMIQKGELCLPGSEEVADMYEHSVEELEQADFLRYEVSNFSKMGAECEHSLSYWTGSDYIGIGPGAHSRFIARQKSSYCHSVNTLEPIQWMTKFYKLNKVSLIKQFEKMEAVDK